MSWKDYIPFVGGDPYGDLAESLNELKGDADALALFPYDDGTFFFKPAYFDKELVGGKGGYETDDGDKIVLDGNGEAVKSLFGTDVILACDPTEHSSAISPIKSMIAHKKELGEWIKVDKRGNILEAGDAILETSGDVEIGLEGSAVQDKAEKENMSMDAALAEMERNGDVEKVYDLKAPAGVAVADGGIEVEQASHVAVDQSKAVDLLPKTMSTTELNTALDKARMEEHEEGKLMNYFVYGIIAGALIVGITGIVVALMMGVL